MVIALKNEYTDFSTLFYVGKSNLTFLAPSEGSLSSLKRAASTAQLKSFGLLPLGYLRLTIYPLAE